MVIIALIATVSSTHRYNDKLIPHNETIADYIYCEDIEKMVRSYQKLGIEPNPLKAPKKCINRSDVKTNPKAMFPIKDKPDICNFWVNVTPPMIVAPWPKNCMIYIHDNACNQYQISRDGKKIISCDVPKNCTAKPTTKKCKQEYPPKNASQPLFGMNGD